MKAQLIEAMTNHGKPIGIKDLCNILNCGVHQLRDDLHNEKEFKQDSKTFKWSLTGTANESKEIKTMANETNENNETKTTNQETKTMTIETIIENLKSGKKTETLKKAKSDALSIGIECFEGIKTKQAFIDVAKGKITEMKQEKDAYIKESTENELNHVNTDNALETTIEAVIRKCETDTLKGAKRSLKKNVLFDKSFKNRDILVEAINAKTKAIFNEALNLFIDTLDTNDAPETKPIEKTEKTPKKADSIETPTTVIPLDENLVNITKNISRIEKITLSNNDDVKAMKSTFIMAINAMAEEISGLKKTIEGQSDTIKTLSNNIKNFDILCPVAPVSVIVENGGKVSQEKVNKAKTAAQLLEELRAEYIKGLKGIEKDIFKYVSGKKGHVTVKDITFSLDDFSPKEIKAGLIKLIKAGLIDKSKQGKNQAFTMAKKSAFNGKGKKAKGNDTKTDKTHAKETKKDNKKGMKKGKKAKGNGYKTIVYNALETGDKYTIVDLVKLVKKERPEIDDKVAKKNVHAGIYFIKKSGIEVIKKAGKYFIK